MGCGQMGDGWSMPTAASAPSLGALHLVPPTECASSLSTRLPLPVLVLAQDLIKQDVNEKNMIKVRGSRALRVAHWACVERVHGMWLLVLSCAA